MYSLRAINADGSTPTGGGVLTAFQKIDAGLPFSDVGALTFDYALSGENANLLTQQREVALFDNAGEVPDARFVIEGSNGNRFDAEGGAIYRTFTGRNLWKLFDDTVVYGANFPTVTTEEKRSFSAANAGTILTALINKSQARGDLPGVTVNFTTAVDSNGAAWNKVVSIDYEVGIPLLQVIQNLVDQGVIEARMVGRQLRVYNVDTLGTDRTTTNPPMVFWSANSYEVPEQQDSRGLKTVALVKGDNGALVEVVDSAAVATYGRRVLYISQGGIADTGTLTIIGEANLGRQKQPRSERTYAYRMEQGSAAVRPFREYSPGDWVFQDTNGAAERVRIRQVTIQQESGEELPAVILTLNDRFLEAEVALARKVNGITNGAKMDGSGTATPTVEATLDTIAPGQVAGLIGSSTAYVDGQGRTWAQVTLDWNALALNADGSTMTDLDRYEVAMKRQADTTYNIVLTTLNDAATLDGFLPNATYNFQVRAIDEIGNAGAWSTTLTLTTASDTTAPPVPSTPQVSDYLGQVRIYWNGLGSASEAMPGDFRHVEVHVSTSSGFTPSSTTLIDVLPTAGIAIATDLTYDTPVFVKFISVDNNGNRSAASTQATATPVRVSGLDVAALAIATSNLGDGAVTALKIADATITSAKIGSAQILNANIANAAIDDAKIANVSAGKLTVGTLTADITVSARIKTANTGARVELNSLGIQAFSSSGAQTVDIKAADGSVTIQGAFRTGTAGGATPYLTIDDATDRTTISFWNAAGTKSAYINSPAGATTPQLGMNTGAYVITGTTQGYSRLFLREGSISLQIVRASDQSAFGGDLSLDGTSARLRVAPLGGASTGAELYLTASEGILTRNVAGVQNVQGRVRVAANFAAFEVTNSAGAGRDGIYIDSAGFHAFGNFVSDIGWSYTPASGWQLNEFRMDRWGGFVMVHIYLERTGGTITAGDITNASLGTVTSSGNLPISQTSVCSQSDSGVQAVSLDSAGAVTIKALTGNITVGDPMRLDCVYYKP